MPRRSERARARAYPNGRASLAAWCEVALAKSLEPLAEVRRVGALGEHFGEADAGGVEHQSPLLSAPRGIAVNGIAEHGMAEMREGGADLMEETGMEHNLDETRALAWIARACREDLEATPLRDRVPCTSNG